MARNQIVKLCFITNKYFTLEKASALKVPNILLLRSFKHFVIGLDPF